MYLARTAEITFCHEVLDVLLTDREFEIAREDSFDLICIDCLSVTLVKQLEALLCLQILAALVPSVTDHEFDDVKVNSLLGENLRVSTLQILIDISLGHLVEPEVVQNVSEM